MSGVFMSDINIIAEIQKLKERNARVEADKAWETSWARRGLLAATTYVVVGLFLVSINAPNPWINSLIPAGAYLLQTLTLPMIKEWWVKKAYGK